MKNLDMWKMLRDFRNEWIVMDLSGQVIDHGPLLGPLKIRHGDVDGRVRYLSVAGEA